MTKNDLAKLRKICDSIRKDNNLWQYPSIEAKVVQAERLVEKANSPKSWDAAYKVIKGQEAVISSEIRGVENGSDEGDLKALYSFRRRLRAAAEKLRKINPLNAKDGVRAKDAEAVIYQVTTSQDKMGRLHTEYFGSSEEVLRKHKGRIDPSSGHPRLDGFVGPFSNGTKNGKRVFLYEDKNTYLSMDSKAKAELG